MSDDGKVNGFAHELTRTASYYVLSHRQGSTLFAQVLANRKAIERLELRLEEERDLLQQALHELARERRREPQRFIRRWLSDHRDLSALAKEEERPV